MDSFILEDVNELLKLKKGDTSRLLRIKESCESNELISLSDRKYVERLTSQFIHQPDLGKKPDKPKFIPIETKQESIKNEADLIINQPPQIEKPRISNQLTSKKPITENSSKVFNLSGNKKIIFSICSVILAIILMGVVTIGYDGIQIQDNSGNIIKEPLPNFSLETDRTSYETSDIISVSGKMSSSSKGTVRLFIENEKNELIWAENVNLKNNGEFSTLLIAGGQGWENNGKYFLNVEFDDFENSISFNFNAL